MYFDFFDLKNYGSCALWNFPFEFLKVSGERLPKSIRALPNACILGNLAKFIAMLSLMHFLATVLPKSLKY
jgi:hypothetical protein